MLPTLAAALADVSPADDPKGPVVADGLVVTLHYTLSDPDGTVLRTTRKGRPLTYLRGPNRLPPGVEQAIDGCRVGDRVEATLPPEAAFGPRRGAGLVEMDRSELPNGAAVVPGRAFLAARPDGGPPIRFWIARARSRRVWIDLDHPLAGRTLRLEAEVVDVRPPTPTERRRSAAPAFAEA